MIRLSGLGLLVICAFAVHQLHALVYSAASHSPTGVELLLLALAVVVTGLGGVLMASAGTELLRLPDDH
jgi:predicted outer membrane lipoprotein